MASSTSFSVIGPIKLEVSALILGREVCSSGNPSNLCVFVQSPSYKVLDRSYGFQTK